MHPLTPEDFLSRSFHNIVFAGGGNRCWWQAGWVGVMSQHRCWQARQLVGASAGAGIATAFATIWLRDPLAAAIERFDATPMNKFEWLSWPEWATEVVAKLFK
jgi:predicted acylesterase/phospholipase RssA